MRFFHFSFSNFSKLHTYLLKIIVYSKKYERVALLLPSIIIFTVVFLPFYGLIPYLDGEVEFLIAVNFYQGKYLSNWITYHPPLKLILSSIFFRGFGLSSYSALGYVLGVCGIIAFYFIAEKIFTRTTACICSLLLSLSGIYIATAIFSLNDFIVTVFLLFALAFYVNNKYVLSTIMVTGAVMSKESTILLAVSICIIEAFQKKFRIWNTMPFVLLAVWILFLHITGHSLWNSWNFSTSKEEGSFWTIVDNILRMNLINKYTYENLLHLFIFNYNWVLWIIALFAIPKLKRSSIIAILILFSLMYTIIILSFQTFSITRYILPVLPLLYLLIGVQITYTKYKYIFIPIVFVCVLLSLFTSSDPVSNKIWQKWQILNQNFYINREIDGDDGITYNMQFLYLAKERNTIIKTRNCKDYITTLAIYQNTLSLLNITPCN